MGTLRNFILTLCLLVSSAFASDLVIVSDLDDTLKVTQVQSSRRAVWNGVFTRKVFAGVPELLNNMQEYVGKTYVLTASPNQIRFNIKRLFKKFNLKIDHLYTRSVFRDRDGFEYKFNRVEKVLEENPSAQLILMGDNTDEDDEVYQAIQKKYPSRIAAIYMHKVKDEVMKPGQQIWISVFDIANYELAAGRMTVSEVVEVFEAVMKGEDKRIIPNKLYCPTSMTDWDDLPITNQTTDMVIELTSKIVKYCQGIKELK
jgi:phosphatidate phosphatase APP1